jgi:hypothetical protein
MMTLFGTFFNESLVLEESSVNFASGAARLYLVSLVEPTTSGLTPKVLSPSALALGFIVETIQ